MKKVDYILVGQGLAGSILALELLKQQKTIQVIDNQHYLSSSKVAAGLVHPMSFKRTILSWNALKLSAHSIDYYKTLSLEFNQPLYNELNFVRIFGSIEEQNNWYSKQTDAVLKEVLLNFKSEDLSSSIINKYGVGRVNWTYRLDIPLLLSLVQQKLEKIESLMNEQFDYAQLKFESQHIEYKNIQADKIIFCEGHQVVNNPFFNYLPNNSTKGELLKIEIEDADFQKNALSKNGFVVPLQAQEYLLGATYDWKNKEHEVTQTAKEDLTERFKAISNSNFKILEHRVGIRPTTLDRKPILGSHPSNEKVLIFNGMGSKGAQLTPYYAQVFIDFLNGKCALEKEINVARFTKKYFD